MTISKRISKSNNKSKTTWNIINDLLGKQHSSQDILKLTIDGNHVTKQHSIANALNKYFSTIIDKTKCHSYGNTIPDNLTPYSYLDQCSTDPLPPMVFKSFSTREILSIIKSLNTKNSSSYDEISKKLLKISANYICSPLTYIFNKSISTGIFPDRLKYLIIKPLYKKGERTDLSNYRPISMLTSFSKVLEKALYNRLIEYLNDNNVLNTQQFGLRKRLSTENAIFKLRHEILIALNNKAMIGSIFFDLAKAFDSVNHLLLIKKTTLLWCKW